MVAAPPERPGGWRGRSGCVVDRKRGVAQNRDRQSQLAVRGWHVECRLVSRRENREARDLAVAGRQ
eukprot:11546418-Alexandrium_andersonii.AAC.1